MKKHEYIKTFGIPYTIVMRLYWKSPIFRRWVAATGDNRRNPIYKKIKKIHANIIEKYRYEDNYPIQSEYLNNPKPVWLFWWQGEEQMPEIIKACWKTIIKHVKPGQGEVQLITKDNYRDYFDLPSYIINNIGVGMQIYDLADIVRSILLAEWGGVWLDANYYASQDLPQEWFRCDGVLTERKNYINYPPHFGNWSSSFLGGPPGTVAMRFARDALLSYWMNYSISIDYTLFSNTLSMAYEELPTVRRDIEKIPFTPHGKRLEYIVDEAYEEKRFNEYLHSRAIHKLTHKRTYSKRTPAGEQTVYAKLIEDAM